MKILAALLIGFAVGVFAGPYKSLPEIVVPTKYSSVWWDGYDRAISLLAECAKNNPDGVLTFLTYMPDKVSQ